MTEAIENGAVLVRLRALVMRRDDTSGGWLPLTQSGSLSDVSIIKQVIPVSRTSSISSSCSNAANTDNNNKFLSTTSPNCSGSTSSRTSSSSSSSNSSNSLNIKNSNHQQPHQENSKHRSNSNNSIGNLSSDSTNSGNNNHHSISTITAIGKNNDNKYHNRHHRYPPNQHSHHYRHRSSSSKQSQQHEYVIYGHGIQDHSLIFRSVIGHDFKYNKVMPTFHNWQSGGKRLGLIFQTAADGRAFDRGVMAVLVQLLDGFDLKSAECSMDIDNEIFMTINLPYKLDDIQSADAMTFTAHSSSINNNNNNNNNCTESFVSGCGNSDNDNNRCTLVESTDLRLYKLRQQPSIRSIGPVYPIAAQTTTSPASTTTSSTAITTTPAPTAICSSSPTNALVVKTAYYCPDSPSVLKKKCTYNEASSCDITNDSLTGIPDFAKQRLICKYCRQAYVESENMKGSCERAPDCVRTGIDTITCIPCARSVVYHCVSNSEVAQPCDCDSHEEGCSRRWLGLALLSILLPCLWCYPPLKVCHLCGVSCGACGGRHEPINNASSVRS